MCQFEPAPLPGFKTTFGATDVVALFFLLTVLWVVLNLVNDPRSLGRRWFGKRGAVIVSLLPGVCVAFAAGMMWLFLIPSSDAIKLWYNAQEALIGVTCSRDELHLAYMSASDRLDPYYTWLFLVPAACGVFGLLLLGWRWPIQLRLQKGP